MLKWIVAMDESRVIWNRDKLPRHYSEDLKRFKQLTQWQICLMWRKTYEGLKQYRPNANGYPYAKKNLIFSSSLDGAIHSIEELQQKYWNEIVWVLWWAKTFETLMPYIDELYLTLIPWKHEWDSFMPPITLEHRELQEEKDGLKFYKYTK